MRTATYRNSSYSARADAGSRGASILLALGIAALIVWALLRLGFFVPGDIGDGRRLSTFDVTNVGERPQPPSQKKAERRVQRPPAAARDPAPTPPRPAPAPPLPVPPVPLHLPGVLILSRADYAAADVSRIKGTPAPDRSAAQDTRTADSAPIGRGPGGADIYMGDWFRRPTPAEMRPYLPARMQSGYGVIVCRTAPRMRVEDCREMGETRGSGLSRAARLASFQFLIRPPSINGKPVIGALVQITYNFRVIERGATDAPGGGDDDGGDDTK